MAFAGDADWWRWLVKLVGVVLVLGDPKMFGEVGRRSWLRKLDDTDGWRS